MANNKLKVIKQDNRKLKLNYFVWGQVDGKLKSFYLEPNQLDGFMKKQNLSKNLRIKTFQIYRLKN